MRTEIKQNFINKMSYVTLVILVLVGSAIARPNFKDERLNFNKERVCGYEVSTLRISVTNLPYQRKKKQS